MLELLDAVELKVATDSWEAGTIGTVVDVSSDRLLVEVSDEQGRTLDLLSLPPDAVRRLDVPDQERLSL